MTIDQRVAKLERQNRWMKRGGGLALAAIACVVLMGQGKPKELPDLRARSLTITDAKGKRRISLHATEAGPRLDLYDATGKPRATLFVAGEDYSALVLKDKHQVSRATLFVKGDNTSVVLHDAKRKKFVSVGILADSAGLTVRDERKRMRIMLILAERGPSLFLHDSKGSPRAIVGVFPPKTNDEDSVHLLDANGNLIWQAPK